MLTWCTRVRTLTGKEIELDIEPDYKVLSTVPASPTTTGARILPEELPLRRKTTSCAGGKEDPGEVQEK